MAAAALASGGRKKPGKRVKWRYNVRASILDLVRCEVRIARFWPRLSRVSQRFWIMRSNEIRRFVGENCQKFSSLQKTPHIILDVTRLNEVVSFQSVAEIQTDIT